VKIAKTIPFGKQTQIHVTSDTLHNSKILCTVLSIILVSAKTKKTGLQNVQSQNQHSKLS